MALVIKDRVKETTTTTGDGTINLAGASSGFQSFVAGVGDGNTTYYALTDANGTAWEIGIGTITDASPDTLARTTLLASSTGSKIVLTSGTHTVFGTYPAGKAVHLDASGNLSHTVDISTDTNLAAGTGITLTGDTLSTTDGDIVHDNLSGFVANEHIDWTTDQGSTNIHAGNYTDTNTMGSGFTVSATTDTTATTITEGEDLFFAAGTGITCATTADGTVTISCTVTDTNTTYTKASFDLDHLFTLVGATADTSENLGTFTGSTIADSQTIKAAIQAVETAVETKGVTAGSSSIVTVGTISSGTWQGTAIAQAYIANDAINGDKIADDAVNSEHYAAGSIDEEHLNATNSPTENYLLSYDDASGGFTWVAAGSGGENNEYSFKTISVSGQDDVVADTTTDTLTLAAGSNVTITTTAASDTVTIAATDTNTQLSQEQVEDFVGGMLGGTETLITVTYQDGTGDIDFVVDNDLSNYDNSSSGFITATLTEEQVEDFVGGMLGGTETGIAVTYQDGTGDIDFVVSDTTVAGDSGSTGITPGDTLTIAGGTNVTTAMSGDTLTVTATDTNTTYTGGTNLTLAGTTFNVDDAFLINSGDDTTTGVITAGGFTTTGTWTFDEFTSGTIGITTVQDSGTTFDDNDTSLMTAAAIADKIEAYGYSTTAGDITGVTAGTGLSGGGASGAVTLNVDASQTQITAVGTIGTGIWQGTAIATAYIADDAITGAKIALFDDSLAATTTHFLIADGTDYSSFALSGDVTCTNGGAVTVAADAITYAKMQNVSADERILGRVSGADGVIEELTKAQVLTFANVEDGADVTDTTNVTSAGALMDSEVTNLAFVKALAKGISDGNVLTANDAVADDDFLRINGTEVEGLTVAEVLTALNVEAAADVTDTANVTSAGALMDSELTDLAGVKGVTISTLQVKPSEGAFANGDKTKLDAIEASADVTDTTNVTAAGALMDSEVTNLATVKALATGISDGNFLTANDAVADNDFLRIDGTEVEGRTASEVLSDIAAAPAAGSSSIVTVGTVGTGTWQGTAIATAYIADDAVTGAKIALFDDSLAATTTHFLIADGTDYSSFALSGDVTCTNGGVVSIADDVISSAELADACTAVTSFTAPLIEGSTSVQTPLIEYTDGDNAITINDGGSVTFAKSINQGIATSAEDPEDDVTLDINLSDGNYFEIDLGSNITDIDFTNGTVGQRFIIRFQQHASSGPYTLAWNAVTLDTTAVTVSWPGGTAPTMTATDDKADTYGFIIRTADDMDGYVIGQNITETTN